MESLDSFFMALGHEASTIVALAFAVIIITNFFKDMMDLKKKQLLWVIGSSSIVLSVAAFFGNAGLMISGAVAIFVWSIGLWKSGKVLAHKAGENKK